MLMLIGLRMLVGVRPVLPSSRESKLRQVEGVSMLTPSMLLRGRVFRDRDTGRCCLMMEVVLEFDTMEEAMETMEKLSRLETSDIMSVSEWRLRWSQWEKLTGSSSGSDLTVTTLGPLLDVSPRGPWSVVTLLRFSWLE